MRRASHLRSNSCLIERSQSPWKRCTGQPDRDMRLPNPCHGAPWCHHAGKAAAAASCAGVRRVSSPSGSGRPMPAPEGLEALHSRRRLQARCERQVLLTASSLLGSLLIVGRRRLGKCLLYLTARPLALRCDTPRSQASGRSTSAPTMSSAHLKQSKANERKIGLEP